jgi:hypothetical protein
MPPRFVPHVGCPSDSVRHPNNPPQGFKKNIIELSVDDPVTVAKMVEFCHCFSYQLVDDGKTAAVHHMRLYFAGGKYKIPELANLALKNFRRECLARWAHPDFIETIRKAYLYSHVPGFSTIQDIILAVAVAAENTFCTKREKHKEFWDLTMEVPTFMRDWMIAQNTAQNITRDPRAPRAQQRYICPACSGVPYLRIYPGETRGHDCRKEIRTKPDYEEPSITEYDAQELFLNENGDMRGGVAQGFEIDEVPNYTPPPTGLPSTPVMASGPHDHLLGKRRSYPIDTPQRSERPAKQQRSG